MGITDVSVQPEAKHTQEHLLSSYISTREIPFTGMTGRIFSDITWQTEAGGLKQLQGQLRLHSTTKLCLGCSARSYLQRFHTVICKV